MIRVVEVIISHLLHNRRALVQVQLLGHSPLSTGELVAMDKEGRCEQWTGNPYVNKSILLRDRAA